MSSDEELKADKAIDADKQSRSRKEANRLRKKQDEENRSTKKAHVAEASKQTEALPKLVSSVQLTPTSTIAHFAERHHPLRTKQSILNPKKATLKILLTVKLVKKLAQSLISRNQKQTTSAPLQQ